MGFFDLFKIKKALSPERLDNKSIFPEQINFSQSAKASDNYCQKIYDLYYKDYPEMPFISKDRELNTNWFEQAKTFSQQSLVSKSMMKRYSDGLLPGHIYMLYWLKKYSTKKTPAYFEYEYGIDFVAEKTFLKRNGYLDELNKPTPKGNLAIQRHSSVIEERHPSPRYSGVPDASSPVILPVGRNIPSSLNHGIITVPSSDKVLIEKEFKQLNKLISFALKQAHLSNRLSIDTNKFLYSTDFTFYEACPYTQTGKLSKYPLSLHYAYASHKDLNPPQDYFGEIHYMQDGSIGKARLIFWQKKHGFMIHLAKSGGKLSVKKVEKITDAKWETIYKL